MIIYMFDEKGAGWISLDPNSIQILHALQKIEWNGKNCRKTGRCMRRGEQTCPTPDAYRFVEGPCLFGAWEGIVLGIHVKLANWGSMKKKQTSDSNCTSHLFIQENPFFQNHLPFELCCNLVFVALATSIAMNSQIKYIWWTLDKEVQGRLHVRFGQGLASEWNSERNETTKRFSVKPKIRRAPRDIIIHAYKCEGFYGILCCYEPTALCFFFIYKKNK